jgi:hypothetical protein
MSKYIPLIDDLARCRTTQGVVGEVAELYSNRLASFRQDLEFDLDFNFFERSYELPRCLLLQGRALIITDSLEGVAIKYQDRLIDIAAKVPKSCKPTGRSYDAGEKVQNFIEDKRRKILQSCRG